MILDAQGILFPQESVSEQHLESYVRSWRDTKWNLTVHTLDGWTYEQHRHWVQTGEEPKRDLENPT